MNEMNEMNDLCVSVLLLFEHYTLYEYPNIVTKASFEEDLYEVIAENFIMTSFNEDFILDFIRDVCRTFGFGKLYPWRSQIEDLEIDDKIDKEEEKKINEIQIDILNKINAELPKQRTDAWYEFRHNLITASSASKVFGSVALQNSLIYEKCQPIKYFSNTPPNEMSPLHHGQKFEPVSIMLYEAMYNTKIAEYGCIRHPKYKFIGASPDGINVDKNSLLYGRMLEIKNPTTRIINGIPKEEYWVQMQLQMETCNLNETDFLETQIKEMKDMDVEQFFDYITDNKKGIIVQFFINGNFLYEYMPLHLDNFETFSKWKEEIFNLHRDETFLRLIFWECITFSCVLVKRNPHWFQTQVPLMSEFWDTIERERIEGCSHRAPNRKKNPFLEEIVF
jgi:putative phage-type endonuclease